MTAELMKPIALCSTCVFFAGGVCKRFPPTPIVIYGQDVLGKAAINLQSHFPPVSTGEFCGEHIDVNEDESDAPSN